MSYLILPHLTTSCPVLPLSSQSYVVFYCHPTLDPTPSYLSLPQQTTSYPVAPSYPILHCILLPPYLTTQSYSILPHLTTSYIVLHYILLTSYPVLPYPTTANHTLHRPTLHSPASLPCPSLSYSILHHPTPPYTVSYCHPNLVLHCFFCAATLYYLILPHLTTSYPVLPLGLCRTA